MARGMTYEQAFERAKQRTSDGIPSTPTRDKHSLGGWDVRRVPLYSAFPRYSNRLRGAEWRRARMVIARNLSERVAEEQVREIREMYSRGMGTQKEIGECYGISHVTVHSIVTRKTWKGIADA
jgi:DNA invertase Pin-like site-specific DNA recombinase